MPKTTHFHPRLDPLNKTRIWKNWSGYLVAPRYQYSETAEYYSIRNAAGLLDTSPLFKYRIAGPEAIGFLSQALARDIRRCEMGQAQYTTWCDGNGFVIQDGVIMRVAESEFFLTSAEPTLRYFRQLATQLEFSNLSIDDISERYGILALQGPHSISILRQLTDAADSLNYFDVVQTEIHACPVTISRTGFTGDLGYELWIEANNAVAVWDAIMSAGNGYNITPIGTTALKMARVEAGLLLLDVDFHSSRFAWVDAQRETPIELGWNWMFRGLKKDNRPFIGRKAVENQIRENSARWKTVGLEVDWHDYERVYSEAGIMPIKHAHYVEGTKSIYRKSEQPWEYAGYATSFLFSSLLHKPIAIAKLPLDLTQPGTEVDLELTMIKRPVNVLSRVKRPPFYNPPRKTASMDGGNNNA